ncbi:hypothetical protein HPULCUR_011149 [Helicostylum pulchrum]|uniref:Vacuolar protein sorting-associated protein 26 n=1 Tax=Helicostylum pulchrum TaxID=562976 RepID=A0ABP9YGC1_9FUNG
MESLFGISTPVDIEVLFQDEEQRKHIDTRVEKDRRERYPIYLDGENVVGKIISKSFQFLSLSQDVASPGELVQTTSFDFEFKNVEKQYECYNGINVRLRYFVCIRIARRLADIVRERDIWVNSYKMPIEVNNSIKMEVGIEDCLHIDFEYNKSNENITKFEIMDGAPVKGETIPIRLFLGGFELGPTFRDINKKFSIRYYLNLVLIDEENRRYFKQQEITMFRRKIDDGYPPDISEE